MLRAAADAYLAYAPNPSFKRRIKDVISDNQRFSARRNDMAHGIVQPYAIHKRFHPTI